MGPGKREATTSSILVRWGYSEPDTLAGRTLDLVLRGVFLGLWALGALALAGLGVLATLLVLERFGAVPARPLGEWAGVLLAHPAMRAAAALLAVLAVAIGVLLGRVWLAPELARPRPFREKVSTYGSMVLERWTWVGSAPAAGDDRDEG